MNMRALIKIITLLMVSATYSSAYALTFPFHNNTEVVGEVKTIKAKHEDTFAYYGRTYDIGAYAMLRANPGVDEWIPGKGQKITIPSAFVIPDDARNGIVINLPELRLYYFDPASQQLHTYPIGIGREDWHTPLTQAKVTEKTENPTWVVPASILAEHEASGEPIPGLVGGVVPPGADNPLGSYRLRLSIPGYLLHGTNSSIGVGRRVTHGCIRLFPSDIEELFHMVHVGTPVTIINEPIKLGWRDQALYLEVHPSLKEWELNTNQRKVLLVDKIDEALAGKHAHINWDLVNSMMHEQSGVPQVISKVN